MIKKLTKEQLDEMNKIVLKNGYLSKKEVFYYGWNF